MADKLSLEQFIKVLALKSYPNTPERDVTRQYLIIVKWYNKYLTSVFNDPWEWYTQFMRSSLSILGGNSYGEAGLQQRQDERQDEIEASSVDEEEREEVEEIIFPCVH